MARAKSANKRLIDADPKYNSYKVSKLINRCMNDGKKDAARKQVYIALDVLVEQHKRDALEILDDVLKAVTPLMEVRSRRVGGAAYQVPMPVRPGRGFSLAVRWLVMEARKRPNATYHTFGEKLAAEMNDALKGEGNAISKRTAVHKMADANKAFAHFRW